ncbi:MAG: ABC transporter permease subunit [Chiayiivirga sp.]|jgi:putrescine transport system permease protein|uniref:ABC transporter permease subunit n=1 Tax=Chiayiivirga sp. TaxID=2041042 RepID=UPI0025BF06C1|nr:ABC transporter permease subunit [Chiayiivirga sp.]MCI1710352.1 ABC transporter permease subunit [Chiayiivirga sp.]MCI1728868.1 ABC transporter permease subunit [Chiayiivirga sp.]
MTRRSWGLIAAMAIGYGFLYLPIVSVIAYSFSGSRLATVWGGFSLRWYAALFQNEQILTALGRSLSIAALSATAAVALGTASGLALSRFGRFPGRGLLSLLNSAPMVMPDVMLGLSSLLLFVALQQTFGWPQRGMGTIMLAHVTLTACYVTVIVRSRLTSLDLSLEEAAMDLGARPWRVFFLITLPLIAPALVAGWLLAFTLSLDDLVIASFTSGPGASTLPMVIYSKVKLGVTPEINALATLIITAVAIGVAVAGWVMHRREARTP